VWCLYVWGSVCGVGGGVCVSAIFVFGMCFVCMWCMIFLFVVVWFVKNVCVLCVCE